MNAQRFPDSPYLGLAQYGAKDSVLFAGRDQHVDACAEIIAQVQTRILLLHGQTGCGKSSFLRAGLIPGLEARGWGYIFLRHPVGEDGAQGEPVFIRCGKDPVANLARELYTFLSRPLQMETALGKKSFELTGALFGADSNQSFIARCTEPQRLLQSLMELSKLQPSTIVIVMDQVEEVLNLNAPDSLLRARFFEFLKLFNVATLNAKLVLCLRKDHSGEFIGLAQLDNKVQTDFKVYLLPEMKRDEVLNAITLPTSTDELPGLGSPHQRYQFDFAPGVADQIVTDLFEAIPSGAILPVVQIVCKDLYEIASHREKPWIIDARLYDKCHLTASVTRHVSRSLRMSFAKLKLSGLAADHEELRWRKVLYRLVRYEGDGRVHTDVMSLSAFRDCALAEGTVANADEVFKKLTHPAVLVLRRLTIPTVGRGTDEPMCSLGHDVVGLALAEMKIHDVAMEREEQRRRQRAKWIRGGCAVALAIASTFALWIGKTQLARERDNIEWFMAKSAAARDVDARAALDLAARALSHADSIELFNAEVKAKARRHLADLLDGLPTHLETLPQPLLADPVAAGRSSLLTSPPGFVSVLAQGNIQVTRVTQQGLSHKQLAIDAPKFEHSTTLSTAEPFAHSTLLLLSTYSATSDIDQRFKFFLLRDDAQVRQFTPTSLLRKFNVLMAAQKQQLLQPTRVEELSGVSLASDSVVLTSDVTEMTKALFVNEQASDSDFSAGHEIRIADEQAPRCAPVERYVPPEQFIVGAQVFSAEFRPARAHPCPVELESIRVLPLQAEGARAAWQLSVAQLPLISDCFQAEAAMKCTYEFSYVNRMTVVTVQFVEYKQSKDQLKWEVPRKSYVIIDSDTGRAKVVADSELQAARRACSAQPSSDTAQPSSDADQPSSDTAQPSSDTDQPYEFMEGTIDDLIFGFKRPSAAQVVRIRPDRRIECSEHLHMFGAIQQWRYAPAFNMLLALSKTKFLAWNLDKSTHSRSYDDSEQLQRANAILSAVQ